MITSWIKSLLSFFQHQKTNINTWESNLYLKYFECKSLDLPNSKTSAENVIIVFCNIARHWHAQTVPVWVEMSQCCDMILSCLSNPCSNQLTYTKWHWHLLTPVWGLSVKAFKCHCDTVTVTNRSFLLTEMMWHLHHSATSSSNGP